MTHFGGKVDFILHSIGMSLNVRKNVLMTIWITIFAKDVGYIRNFFP